MYTQTRKYLENASSLYVAFIKYVASPDKYEF